MRTRRFLATGAAALAVMTFSLTGCGGGDGGGGGGEGSDQAALVDELMQEIEGDTPLADEQRTCLRDSFGSFSTEELTTLKETGSDTDIPADLQEKVITAVTLCIMADMPTDEAS